MKLLVVHNYYRYTGGEDIYSTSLVSLLKREKHEVKEISRYSNKIQDNTIAKMALVKNLFYNNNINREFEEIIKRFKPELVHFNNINPLISASAYHVCARHNIPIVQTIHNYQYMCPKKISFKENNICKKCLNKSFAYPAIIFGCCNHSRLASLFLVSSFFFHKLNNTFEKIDAFIFPSEFTKSYYLKYTEISEKKSHVLPYFVNINKFYDNSYRKNDYFLFVGRLSEEKGILELLNIFKLLPDIKLIVIGDGPLRDKVSQYKKYNNIIVKNFLKSEEIFIYMKNAIATVIPSLFYETGPIVMIESFANSTPVIAPNFGSFKEAVKDCKTGLFYKQNNFKDLQSKILFASDHKTEVLKMGQNAREEYEVKYTPEKHYQSLMKVYNSLL